MSEVHRVRKVLTYVVWATSLVGCFQIPPEPVWQGGEAIDVIEDGELPNPEIDAEESGSEETGDVACVDPPCTPDACEGAECGDVAEPLDADAGDPPDVCAPDCDEKSCGGDGCGGSCGMCLDGLVCNEDGVCTCVPQCEGRECGEDSCGDFCGTCAPGQECTSQGACECAPDCQGKVCGDDGCGGSCGNCQGGTQCASGSCECVPDCLGKSCGSDGCGGDCGTCGDSQECSSQQQCVCMFSACGDTCCPSGELCHVSDDSCCDPSCGTQECGFNACGEPCGDGCATNELCDLGSCICVPDCEEKECGSDGCGGTCAPNACAEFSACSESGVCECEHTSCVGNCCTEGDVCHEESCCTPDCTDKVCGEDDGCGGICTACASAEALQCSQLICPVEFIDNPIPTACVFAGYQENGTLCDDGDACTVGDVCENGACLGPVCPGSGPCKELFCQNGACALSYDGVGTSCDDDNPCTENDTCVSPQGTVVTVCEGVPLSCDDGNPCTNDTCAPTGECTHAPVADGTGCNPAGICIQGACCQDSCIASSSCDFASCGSGCGLCPGAGSTCVESSCEVIAGPDDMQLVQAGLGHLGCSAGSASCDESLQGEDESPEVLVYLSAYAIDTFEVTSHDFNAFLESIGGPQASCGSSEFGPCVALDANAWSAFVNQGPWYPASHVTWMGASDYCASKSKRLCTEAEWERAARHDAGVWPWGDSPAPGSACTQASHGGVCGDGPSVVGSHPAGMSHVEAHDMSGNVAEWTADFYSPEIYQSHVNASVIAYQPVGPGVGTGVHVIRGGSFASLEPDLTSTARSFAPSDLNGVPVASTSPDALGTDEIGFRCCVDVASPGAP